MSVFLKNTCQYSTCLKNFYSLKDLIVHIENDHLDFDPHKIEQLEEEKPESIPLSYVLKYSTPEDSPPLYSCKNEVLFVNETVINDSVGIPTISEVVTPINNNYLGCDAKDKNTAPNSTKSNDLRLKEEISAAHILGNHKLFTLDNNHKKPFACNMPGCEKRYKNVNGIKYHYKNHHKLYTPTFKKSLLKYKPLVNHSGSKKEKRDSHGVSLLNYKSQTPDDVVYHKVQNITRFEENEGLPNEYFYKYSTVPTSDFRVNQVPLPNMSFNYYNVSDSGDIEDFAGKNSTSFFIPTFDKA